MFQMASRKARKPDPLRVSPEYGLRLYTELSALRRAGENDAALAKRAGVSRTTLWRLKDGEGTVKAARMVRAYIAESGGTLLPDPVSTVEDPEDSEWCDIGRELRKRWPHEYRQLKSALSKRMAARATLEEADAEFAAIFSKES